MKENFPNLVKKIDFQEAQRVPQKRNTPKKDPKKLNPKRNTSS